MNADCYYRIGTEHDACEDYALSGVHGNFGYIIVCDGCSSSPDVDFGARTLALSAREILRIARNSPLTYEAFGLAAIRRADTVSAILPQISPQFLDSTLLIAWVDNGQLTAHLYGDGVFLHKTRSSTRAVHIHFQIPMDGAIKPAPDYLSYHLDQSLETQYRELGGTKEVYDCIIQKTDNSPVEASGSSIPHRPFDPVVIKAAVAPGDVIAVCSDGINSFRHADDAPVSWIELIDEFVGFKNYEGVFVRRRMAAFERKCRKQLMSHSDDVSLAAIVV